MSGNLTEKYSAPVPRYTSYPTAPHFSPDIAAIQLSNWLEALENGDELSLYIHIPYCDRLCWFCACHTKHTLKYEPITSYLNSLHKEIELISAKVSRGTIVTAVHWGGGSPTMLKPDDMRDLMSHLHSAFNFSPAAEISIEMDPNDLDDARFDALADIGMTRASLGVQDFADVVQQAINRPQSFEQTKAVVDAVRSRGVSSVNCDILYGLPFQTLDSIAQTIHLILSLSPDRIALFGYAHVPWMKKHQTMINEDALPNTAERYAQMNLAGKMLIDAGYQAIGIDHFAKPGDSLAIAASNGQLARNFQGYTTDRSTALIGLGASSISQFPQGYMQNMPATGEYQKLVDAGHLAGIRGVELTDEDRARAWLICEIMCFRPISLKLLEDRFGAIGSRLSGEIREFVARDVDGLTSLNLDEFSLSPIGMPYARVVAAAFDAYLNTGRGRHSAAV